ncbi:hypothetical protein PF005_g22277 [Phytophthora fragariae]|uniref:Uncharacterized protein n=1 Tax=Phytophthora fragariae TaxID=53985 RepID=A0A6A3WHT8_9STRA|nr:hypothetical protein PF003_g33760 [Phytophthora fragariae]KAE8926734.1 hypothetical protein PF009_g23080 [Phytophthora fragariae]KAE8959573.1 hypothetical protein PF011_g30380 [Phytophthora fragariae]KAE9063411.1 hypothetical protein PF006_g30955 [Phytophthora fragariae]KAE9165553.1 hypothetical protein PF002_g31338 [Phytophthora fragariae]
MAPKLGARDGQVPASSCFSSPSAAALAAAAAAPPASRAAAAARSVRAFAKMPSTHSFSAVSNR